MRLAARIDENQPGIVRELRERGISVQSLAAVGSGCPDLVLGYRGRCYMAEVKDPSKPPSKRRLTPDQLKWHREWNGQVAVIETVNDALRLLGIM